jgi:hypothetical protein
MLSVEFMAQRSFQVRFRLKTGNSPMQTVVIQASDVGTARKIFEQQNPGCQISDVKEVK